MFRGHKTLQSECELRAHPQDNPSQFLYMIHHPCTYQLFLGFLVKEVAQESLLFYCSVDRWEELVRGYLTPLLAMGSGALADRRVRMADIAPVVGDLVDIAYRIIERYVANESKLQVRAYLTWCMCMLYRVVMCDPP